MANGKDPKRGAHTEQDETVFSLGVLWVTENQALLIVEDGLGFLE